MSQKKGKSSKIYELKKKVVVVLKLSSFSNIQMKKKDMLFLRRHGVTRTEIHTLNDPDLTFLSSMKEYERDPVTFKQKILAKERAELENLMKLVQKEQEAKEGMLYEKMNNTNKNCLYQC